MGTTGKLSERLHAHGQDHFCADCRAAAAEARALEVEIASVKVDNEAKARANAQLVAEVARLREEDKQNGADLHSVLVERDALRAGLREANGEIEGLQTELRYSERQADALRAKLDAVRAVAEGGAVMGGMTESIWFNRIIYTIDGEGGDE